MARAARRLFACVRGDGLRAGVTLVTLAGRRPRGPKGNAKKSGAAGVFAGDAARVEPVVAGLKHELYGYK